MNAKNPNHQTDVEFENSADLPKFQVQVIPKRHGRTKIAKIRAGNAKIRGLGERTENQFAFMPSLCEHVHLN